MIFSAVCQLKLCELFVKKLCNCDKSSSTPLRYYQYRGGIFLFITVAAEDVHMTSVASWYVDAYKIPYGVQEV